MWNVSEKMSLPFLVIKIKINSSEINDRWHHQRDSSSEYLKYVFMHEIFIKICAAFSKIYSSLFLIFGSINNIFQESPEPEYSLHEVFHHCILYYIGKFGSIPHNENIIFYGYGYRIWRISKKKGASAPIERKTIHFQSLSIILCVFEIFFRGPYCDWP